MKGLIQSAADGLLPCWWCGSHADYRHYHDAEWGFPVGEDHRLFEKICLEGFQSGLSWLTILRKRENFRRAFAGFDFEQVARFGQRKVEELLKERGIVRHRKKIESVLNNARQACCLAEEFGSLGAFFWGFEPPRRARPLSYEELLTRTQTPESKALSKELKQRGWSFIGPTTAYAFMQAMGLVNDHLNGCHCWEKVEAARRNFRPPS